MNDAPQLSAFTWERRWFYPAEWCDGCHKNIILGYRGERGNELQHHCQRCHRVYEANAERARAKRDDRLAEWGKRRPTER